MDLLLSKSLVQSNEAASTRTRRRRCLFIRLFLQRRKIAYFLPRRKVDRGPIFVSARMIGAPGAACPVPSFLELEQFHKTSVHKGKAGLGGKVYLIADPSERLVAPE